MLARFDRRSALLASSLLMVSALSEPLAAQSLEDSRLRVATWATGLARPTAFTFIGENDMLVLQKEAGVVIRVIDGSTVSTVLDLDVSCGFSRGGLGMIKDPDFDTNGYVYVLYSASDGGDCGNWTDNRVMRFTFDGSDLVSAFGPVMSIGVDPMQNNPLRHNSGFLRFGPDGKLYGQHGDLDRGDILLDPRIEQNTGTTQSSNAGGIWRVNPDGSIPADNPFVGEAEANLHKWYVYGFRNSFGFDFDPITDELWFGENGPFVWDELNRGGSGMNSGWLKILGPDARDATYDENEFTAYDAADLTVLPGSFYRDPEFSWAEPIGVAALCFLDSKRFPEDLQNVLLVGEANNDQLYAFDFTPNRMEFLLSGALADKVADDATERDQMRFGTSFNTVPDIQVGPDGYVYVLSYFSGELHRIRPVTDFVEPTALEVLRGALTQGAAVDLERSDDVAVRVGGELGGDRWRVRFETTFFLPQDDPDRIDLLVESRGNSPSGTQVLQVLHVPSSTWQTVDERALPRVDAAITVADIASPGDYVDSADRSVHVRVIQRSGPMPAGPGPHGQPGGATAERFRTHTDQVRLLVTFP